MLVSLNDMKTFLGVSGTEHDTFLTEQLTLISETVESYCNRKFQQSTWKEVFYREDLVNNDRVIDELTCYYFPLVSIASVLEKKNEADAGVPVADYRVHGPTGKIIKKRYERFFVNGDIVEVTYSAGFAPGTIPTPVLNVVKTLVQERYNKKVNGIDMNFGADVQSIAIPGVINIQYDFSLNNNERKNAFGVILGSNINVLDFYRSERRVVGSGHLAFVGGI